MAKFGRRPITEAGKPRPDMTYFWDGEERIDRRPQGRAVERFVDPQGNVVTLQLAGDGDPQRLITVDRERMQHRRNGFVEHAKCPLRSGVYVTAGPTGRDFSSLPKNLAEPCDGDTRTLVKHGHEIHATKSCPHVEWLIDFRVKREKAQAEKRNAKRIADEKRTAEAAELQAAQLEMVKEQIEERRRTRKPKAQVE